jgi:hypothetical protein
MLKKNPMTTSGLEPAAFQLVAYPECFFHEVTYTDGHEIVEVTGDCRKIHYVELHNLYFHQILFVPLHQGG